MFDSTTELLSYALLLFLAYVYLPYTLFKFGAERIIDLGRRRDFTQLEEIIAGFVPTIFLHLQTTIVYLVVNSLRGAVYTIDFSVVASMFGRDRGAVSDYLYVGHWRGFLLYLGELWAISVINGVWFGKAVYWIAKHDNLALQGLDVVRANQSMTRDDLPFFAAIKAWFAIKVDWLIPAKGDKKKLPRWLHPAWWFWYSFFHESIVPLFAWVVCAPEVRVETADHRVFYGRFIRYEKTTDGRLDAIRLSDAKRVLYDERVAPVERRAGDRKPVDTPFNELSGPFESLLMPVGTVYLKWAQVSDIIVLRQKQTRDIQPLLRHDPRRPTIQLREAQVPTLPAIPKAGANPADGTPTAAKEKSH